jgi:hypothetical protein
MNEQLKSKIRAAKQMAIETLLKLDMDQKGSTITAAKLQARQEAFSQVITWAEQMEG